jgi:rhodanese-related sulfurtransferase
VAPAGGAASTASATPAAGGAEAGATPGAEAPATPGAEASATQVPASTPAADAALDPATFGRMLTVPQARVLYEQGAFFVDGRVRAEFDAGRIPGALHATPAMLLDGTSPDVLALPRELPVVIYCGGGDCTDSENIAIVLTQAGFTRLFILKDGYPGWKDAGLPVEEPASGGEGASGGARESGGAQ